MSWRHTEAIASIEGLRPPTAAVLMALAHHADQFTGRCYPSIERIELFTRLSRRSIQQAVTDLIDQQLLVADRQGGRGRATSYALTLPSVTPIDQTKGAPLARKGAPPAQKGAGPAPQQSCNSHEQGRALREAEPLPHDWWPDDMTIARARKDFPHVDIDTDTHRFRDNAVANGEVFLHPVAAWRKWIGRGEQFAKRDREAQQRNARAGARPDAARNLERLRALAADEVVSDEPRSGSD